MLAKNQPVYIAGCGEYDEKRIKELLSRAFDTLSAEEEIRGKRVVIKPNLVRKMDPALGGTTHPEMLKALCRLLFERGARSVLIAESPGGVYNPTTLGSIYGGCGVAAAAKQAGAELNYDCSYGTLFYEEGKRVRSFQIISPVLQADTVINLCKLKSHGMMTMSAAVKNLFGTIPGVMKFEMHARFPENSDFAEMLADLNGALYGGKSVLSVCDGILGMEGNGPTSGIPRKMGVVLVSKNTFNLDLAAARILGLKTLPPLLQCGVGRGWCPEDAGALCYPHKRPEDFLVEDFLLPDSERKSTLQKVLTVKGGALARFFEPRPMIGKDCKGCLECVRSCPQKTVLVCTDKKGRKRARIDPKKCIKCYCCQELCPFGCVKIVKNPLIALAGRL